MLKKDVTRILPVKLTEAEEIELGQSLAQCKIDIAALEQRKADIAKSFKAEIDGKNEWLLKESRVLKAGEREKDVDCTIMFNSPLPGMKRIIRLDTGEETETCPMTSYEIEQASQPSLFEKTDDNNLKLVPNAEQ